VAKSFRLKLLQSVQLVGNLAGLHCVLVAIANAWAEGSGVNASNC